MAFVLEPKLPLDAWLDELDSWLARSPNFFSSKPVILELAGLEVELMEYRELLRRLTLRHIRVMAVENPSRNLTGPHLPPTVTGGGQADAPTATEQALPAVAEQSASPAAIPAKFEKPTSLIIDDNVRSGQSIVHPDGDVTIVGRVASGAEIIAGGSVHVYGALQGRVIAGASGLPGARIFCTEARPEMLCIGGAYFTAEDMDSKTEGRCLEVRLVGEKLKFRVLD